MIRPTRPVPVLWQACAHAGRGCLDALPRRRGAKGGKSGRTKGDGVNTGWDCEFWGIREECKSFPDDLEGNRDQKERVGIGQCRR